VTTYIACYSLHLALKDGSGDVIDPLTTETFEAKNDGEAMRIAENKRCILEILENTKPGLDQNFSRTVILTSVRNQHNKQMVFCIGRTET
jgi:hypothetical protein